MRKTTASQDYLLAQVTGSKPATIVEVEWASGTQLYGDIDQQTDDSVIPAIMNVDAVDAAQTVYNRGETSSITIVLSDHDGSLKRVVNTLTIEGVTASVYLWWTDKPLYMKMLLLTGYITSDIVWDEAERSLTFTIETLVVDAEIGFAPDLTDLPDLHEREVDAPWPLCVGHPLKVLSQRLFAPTLGELGESINKDTISFQVNDGNDFPQATEIDIYVDDMKMTGSFSGDTFTPTAMNVQLTDTVTITPQVRDTSDADYTNYRVCWLSSESVDLTRQYLVFRYWSNAPAIPEEYQYCVCQVTRHIGTKVWLSREPFFGGASEEDHWEYIDGPTYFAVVGAAIQPHEDWDAIGEELEANYYYYKLLGVKSYVVNGSWTLDAGVEVRYNNGQPIKYIANLVESSSIHEVFAWRSYEGRRIFAAVPSSYYTVTLDESIAGQVATTLVFQRELTRMHNVDGLDEKWETDIYVSLKSTIPQNPATAIKWILDNYSNLNTDSVSFTTAATLCAAYPVNFVIHDQPNARAICEEIAYQARCALVVRNGTAYIKYLSSEPEAIGDARITADEVIQRSLSLAFSQREDLVTRRKATWRFDDSGRESQEHSFTYRRNISAYGLVEEEEDFWVYNSEELVQKSVGFWGYRSANIWRLASYMTFLEHTAVEPFDCLLHRLAIISSNDLRSEVTAAGIDSETPGVSISVTLASKMSDHASGEPIEDTSFWSGDPDYLISDSDTAPTDPIDGRHEVDYDVPGDKEPHDPVVDEPGAGGGSTTLTAQPTTLTAKPTTLTAVPTTLTAKPTTLTAAPTTLTAAPTTLTALPTLTAQPTTITAAPTTLTFLTTLTAAPTTLTALPTLTAQPTTLTAKPVTSTTTAEPLTNLTNATHTTMQTGNTSPPFEGTPPY